MSGSSGNLTPTQRWLRSVVGPYAWQDFVITDVDRTLSTFTALSPKTEQYTYDDGRQHLLLCLSGTLPINFKGATYNIPVALWLPHDYPKGPPIAYVTPTATMLVRPSKIVDVSGRLGGEYLSSWTRKSEGCNMVQFCELLQAVFSREPPLYAKPQSAISSATPKASGSGARPDSRGSNPPISPTGGHRPAPPIPGSNGSPGSPARQPLPDPRRGPSSQSTPPPRPPLPLEPYAANGLPPERSRSTPLSGPPGYAHRPAPRPPLPQLPVGQSPTPTPSTSHAPHRPLPPAMPQHAQTAPPNAFQSPAYSQQPPTQPFYAQQPPTMPQPPPPPQPQPQAMLNLLDEQDEMTPAAPERSAAASNAPQRPVNPDLLRLRGALQAKLDHALAALASQHQAEAESLANLGTDLAKGGPALADEMARLEAVRDVCLNVRDRYADVVGRAERNLADLAQKGEPEVDDIVCSTTVVYNQLLDLVAEDHAIEDTCYQLYSALNADPPRIELDKFLKRIRTLGREQFVKRALANKIILEVAIHPPRS